MKTPKPIHFKQVNAKLKGSAKDVEPLPIYRGDGIIVSCLKFPFWKRVKILFTGNVWLCVKGETHPPL